MARKHQRRPDEGRRGCEMLPGGSHASNSNLGEHLQAQLEGARYDVLIDDALLPAWRDAGGLRTLGAALALAGKVRRERLVGKAA